ncbi:DNA integration/recombination/inversion protein(Res) [Lactiplantibacillus plantarum]|nr:DNA integration/recombination/inversion protein(Res) [Lactiplantibacillus plantarum]
MKIGYARVSSEDQNLARQIEALQKSGAEKIFQEKISGKSVQNRPELRKMLNFVREKDIVTVLDLDRLGRNAQDITDTINLIQEKGATLDVLSLPSFADVHDANLRALLTNLVFEIYKYTAEEERKKIHARQQQGIQLAKERGEYKGRARQYSQHGSKRYLYNGVVQMLKAETNIAQIARNTGVQRRQIYRIKNYALRVGDLDTL